MPANEKYAVELHELAASELLIAQVDCQNGLRSGVTISSISSCASLAISGATALTIGSPQVSGGVLTINGVSVAAGKAITFTVTGGTAGTEYTIKALCVLSSGETKAFYIRINRLSS